MSNAQPRPLSLVFYDLNNPLDKTFWAGTSAHIIHRLRQAGHQVRVVGPVLPFVRRSVNWLYYHYFLWFRRKHYHQDRDVFWTRLYSFFGSLKLLRHKNADAILTCSPPFTAYLRTRVPIFLLSDCTWGQLLETYPHFHPENQAPHIVRGGLALDRVVFNREDVHMVMTSEWAANRILRDYGADPRRISILPFGANFPEDPSDAAVEHGIAQRGKGSCRLLFVGRDWLRKGGPLAVQIAAELRGLGVPAELHVVGCQPTDAPEFVHIYGLLSKDKAEDVALLQKLYTESDFFLMPVRGEAQGIVFNESAAYGLPAVATDVGGVSAVVRSGEWGLLLPPGSPARNYAEWLRAAYLDRPAYEKMARAARADYLDRLSGKVYAERLAAIIRSALVHRDQRQPERDDAKALSNTSQAAPS